MKIMKTISQHLKQAFNALEFTNAGNLTSLTTMLDKPGQSATPAHAERVDAAKQDASAIGAMNSPC
jgi:hypothetical protein